MIAILASITLFGFVTFTTVMIGKVVEEKAEEKRIRKEREKLWATYIRLLLEQSLED